MKDIIYKVCSDCGVAAILVDVNDTLDTKVECNNCHSTFKLRDIIKNPIS